MIQVIQTNKLPSIFLVGPMGAGKTTIGRLLARKLGREFIDIDHYIEEQAGVDIPWIFNKEGEQGFRDRESKAVSELTQLQGLVLATGGGVVMREVNRHLLAQRGLVIYLNADVSVQLQRTAKSKNRPLLKTENPRQVLQDLYDIRNPLYQQIADIEVVSGRLYPKKMMLEVIEKIKDLGYIIDES